DPPLPGPVALHPRLLGDHRRPGRRPRSVAEGRRGPLGRRPGRRRGHPLARRADHLRGPADHQPAADATDPVDAAAINGIAASRLRTMPGTKFAAVVQAVTGGLAQTSAPRYEEALACLGQLAGAAVPGRSGDDAEPDAVWMFRQQLWAAFEAKSECKPAGTVSADTARQAGGHLNYTADSAGKTA